LVPAIFAAMRCRHAGLRKLHRRAGCHSPISAATSDTHQLPVAP
jgi:hypothetical protein